MKPPVTVIIPTMNEKEGIKYVLSNMQKEIATEIIVVASSSDETPKIAKEFGATVIREDRRIWPSASDRNRKLNKPSGTG